MAYKQVLKKLITPAVFIFIGAIARVLPHAPNFTPIAAMALFSGSYLTKKQALTIPLMAMLISDVLIGFDSLPMRLAVYGSFLITVLIGIWLKNHKSTKNIILATLFSSSLFFIITNFSVWAFGTMYPKSVAGLLEAYFYAIPFFRNTILGDMFYSGAFFGGYEFVSNLIRKNKFALES
jgi:hypothetical protein